VEHIDKKLINWASILEPQTREQAQRAASMPFIWPHLALMPDAHLGKGATVGSVIPTVGAIIPAAVGVDIGCFLGETRVPLLDGRQRTLKDMAEAGGIWWVYSVDAHGQVTPGRAVALKTRTDAELMKVTVSGGDEIICTPDHQFMMVDGTYLEAHELRFNDSLMPLYRKWQTRDGYESVSIGRRGGVRETHILVYEALNGPVPPGYVVHHKNHVHFDNRPDNLEVLEAGEHSRHHRRRGRSFDNASPEFRALRLAGVRRSNSEPAMHAQRAAVGTANITRYMTERPEHFEAAVAGNGKRGAPILANFNVTPRACDDCGEVAANPAALRWHKKREHGYNHKVIAVEALAERADVYCLQVEEHHNFALAAGVFVHNCGMIAVRTDIGHEDLAGRPLAPLRDAIERSIPLSAGQYNASVRDDEGTRARVAELESLDGADSAEAVAPNWRLQLGTLGSGNHFIEVSLDEADRVWLFLHSGSRGVGNKLATKSIRAAQAWCARAWISLPDPDLAYLVEGEALFWEYIRDLRWAQHFALLNRAEMMARAHECLSEFMGRNVAPTETIQCHHNYTEQMSGDLIGHWKFPKGRTGHIWLSRKGAIDASLGKLGLIPGSMGTRSYVVTGKGNKLALNSSPHGAGRSHSRSAARRAFSLAELDEAMKGIEWRRTDAFLDEIPGAYKDVDVVMADAADLVEVRHTLRQIVNVKGD
jgi:tRNA-splicing ligase RtcB (3'-phosphate/5'-hydroxy nucleic acid ligase)